MEQIKQLRSEMEISGPVSDAKAQGIVVCNHDIGLGLGSFPIGSSIGSKNVIRPPQTEIQGIKVTAILVQCLAIQKPTSSINAAHARGFGVPGLLAMFVVFVTVRSHMVRARNTPYARIHLTSRF